jgi:predicted nucleotidyltransferase component of viral defense system
MNLFDKLVTEAIKNQPDFSTLRMVIEKELLHHDILRIISHHNLLSSLTFIGGTCLRMCYGGTRLSEDLDFTGGHDFSRSSLSSMGKILTENLEEKYALRVMVSDPIKDKQNVDTWKIKIETRPEKKDQPAQRINIDICAIPSYERQPMMLLNPYGVEMGTSGLIIQAQSKEEIYTDKLIAFAFRPNRIKYRDLWDMAWLHGQSIKPRLSLIPNKLSDRDIPIQTFLLAFSARNNLLSTPKIATDYIHEMRRFLPAKQIPILAQENYWQFLVFLMNDLNSQVRTFLMNDNP